MAADLQSHSTYSSSKSTEVILLTSVMGLPKSIYLQQQWVYRNQSTYNSNWSTEVNLLTAELSLPKSIYLQQYWVYRRTVYLQQQWVYRSQSTYNSNGSTEVNLPSAVMGLPTYSLLTAAIGLPKSKTQFSSASTSQISQWNWSLPMLSFLLSAADVSSEWLHRHKVSSYLVIGF